MELDHLAVVGADLDAAAAHVEAALGLAMGPGGAHPAYGTHNRLMGLGPGCYLEAIAIDPEAPAPAHPRWFGLDRLEGPPRLAAWIARVADLDAVLAALPGGFGAPVDLARGDLRWRMAVPADGGLPWLGAAPALIEWQAPHPAGRLPDTGLRLAALDVRHAEADALERMLRPHLGDAPVRFAPGEVALAAHLEGPEGRAVLR